MNVREHNAQYKKNTKYLRENSNQKKNHREEQENLL